MTGKLKAGLTDGMLVQFHTENAGMYVALCPKCSDDLLGHVSAFVDEFYDEWFDGQVPT